MKNANVYDLNSKRRLAANDCRLIEPVDAAANEEQAPSPALEISHPSATARVSRGAAWGFVFVLFQLLNWPRPLLVGLMAPVIALSILALVVVGVGMDASSQKSTILWSLGGASLAASVFLWVYEVVLIKLQAVIFRT